MRIIVASPSASTARCILRRIDHSKSQTPSSAHRGCQLCTARREPISRVSACQSAIEPLQESDSPPKLPDSKSRRSLRVTFTCDRCEFVCCLQGDRTERLVNPHAWDKGLVYLQCKGCEVWHKLKDNANLVEEIYLADSA